MDLYLGGSYSWSLKTGYPLLLVTVHPALPVATKSSLLMPQNEARHLEREQKIENLNFTNGQFFLMSQDKVLLPIYKPLQILIVILLPVAWCLNVLWIKRDRKS